jgi:uncharacterized membrane protein YgcG
MGGKNMFCKWCGKQFDEYSPVCPNCGKEQDALVNGNGFWDLCNIEPNTKTITPEAEQENEVSKTVYADGFNADKENADMPENNGADTKDAKDLRDKKKKKILIIEIIAVAVAVVAVIVILLFSFSAKPAAPKKNTTIPTTHNKYKPSDNKAAVSTTAPATTVQPTTAAPTKEDNQGEQDDDYQTNEYEQQSSWIPQGGNNNSDNNGDNSEPTETIDPSEIEPSGGGNEQSGGGGEPSGGGGEPSGGGGEQSGGGGEQSSGGGDITPE